MNLQRIPRRLAVPAAPKASGCATAPRMLPFRPLNQHRNLSSSPVKQKQVGPPSGKDEVKPRNPLLEAYLKKKPTDNTAFGMPKRGDLAKGSVFDTDAAAQADSQLDKTDQKDRNARAMAMALDPDPEGRQLWERKMVMREIRRRGRLTKVQILKRTERESLSKSPFFKTSLKKLGALARQIAGKTVDEALVQMRFSKKKAAQHVRAHLEYARDVAMVRRGMGLGQKEEEGGPAEIQLKDGKRHKVPDKTKIYVDQAWVGRGEYVPELEFRARGRVNVLMKPYTSISVLLKEEATRVRQSEERKEKEDKRKPWLQLPDRNVSAQHQYPLW
ncbi:ribosomal protein L22 [Rhizodiscina lignyota]|uniref:Ribosomal protein L22 n=1 Tax=Rhizodiscina lignyota TaxID=1504668 RepID=A0A9P4ICU9_9PEZI|nr:ribosomal protein L22 [Rhizodiscina lignyota]